MSLPRRFGIILLLLTGCVTTRKGLYKAPWTPEVIARLQPQALNESSGLVPSMRHPGWYWSHNDSGNDPLLFCIDASGRVPAEVLQAGKNGVIRLTGAKNKDWEDITRDDRGNLYVGDIGNNKNERRSLKVYRLAEPDPTQSNEAAVDEIIRFRFPDQSAFPPEKMNFDAEGLFWAKGHLYLLSKHRSDDHTKLYRFKASAGGPVQTLELLQEVDIGGMVTAADYDAEQQCLAVLTYEAVWLFDLSGGEVDLCGPNLRRRSLDRGVAQQCEAVCIVGDHLLLTNEQRSFMQVPLSELQPCSRLRNLLLP